MIDFTAKIPAGLSVGALLFLAGCAAPEGVSKDRAFIDGFNVETAVFFQKRLTDDEVTRRQNRCRALFPGRKGEVDDGGINFRPETAPVLLSVVPLEFPPSAAVTGTGGKVYTEFLVEADGTVRDAVIVGVPSRYFDEEALRCVRQWKFKPATGNGKPCCCVMGTPLSFRISPYTSLGRPKY